MQGETDELRLSESEREKLLFILGAYAHTLSTEHWTELSKYMEEFAVDLASRAYDSGREQGIKEASHTETGHGRRRRGHPTLEQDA